MDTDMDTDIKKIEDLSLNAWPSHQMQLYDGWILRYSFFYTHRTNCVEEIAASTLPMPEKVSFCEELYRRWRTPCIFKITPLSDRSLDPYLAGRGYRVEHTTDVMRIRRFSGDVPRLSGKELPAGFSVFIWSRVNARWLDGLFYLKNTVNPDHLRVVPAMYDAIPKDEIAVLVMSGNMAAGIGLGILDRDEVGIYAIHTHRDFRRRGLASFVVRTILREAAARGARGAYLQVVRGNEAARSLYREIGFEEAYTCWYRVRHDTASA